MTGMDVMIAVLDTLAGFVVLTVTMCCAYGTIDRFSVAVTFPEESV
jgi:hypothetical protein